NPGTWSGYVTLQGSGVTMQIPYLYLVPDATPFNIVAESSPKCGSFLDSSAGKNAGRVQIKVTDDTGLPVSGSAVTFTVVPRKAATLQNVSARTDNYGIASAEVILGSTAGDININAAVGRAALQNPFRATIRQPPAISAGQVTALGNADSSKGMPVGS